MNLRKAAEGRACQIRLPSICNFDARTTVLAHVRLSGITGGGQKAPDLLGAWACSACHTVTERAKADDSIQRAFLEGVMRTQYALIREGAVTW